MQKLTLIITVFFLLSCSSTVIESTNSLIYKPDIKPHKSKKRIEFGDTCYTLNEKKYNEAESLLSEKKTLNKQMTSNIMKNEKALNRINEIDKSLLIIGEPNSFYKQCYFANDNLAPRNLRETGQQWCAIGLKTIPILNTRVDEKLKETIKKREIEDSNFSEHIKIKQKSMCKL